MGKYETHDYDVLVKEEDFEIRQYEDFFIVEYESDQENASGFQTLFSYISRDNKENKKMAFVVPGAFGEQIPKPNNPKT